MTTALNLCRREHRSRTRVEGQVNQPSGRFSTETIELREALGNLPVRQRTAVVLFYIGDFSIDSIAAAMNISDGAVKAHLSQGRRRLRELLEVDDD